MKKLLLIFLFLFPVIAWAQMYGGGHFSRVTDSTSYVEDNAVIAYHSAGYADIFYSTASDLWWKWNGTDYELLGSGSGGGAWGTITGTLSDQTDLQGELDDKANLANTATALTDGSSISITGVKHTLTTTQSAITFSDSWVGDFTTISVTFTQTSAVWTFPAGALCVVDGVASGDNTATVTGTSGDKIVLSIWDVDGTTYHVITKNFGQ
jgi:hypothetical protein